MVKNNNLLETNFEKNKKKNAIETNTKKITYSDLKERSIELINFFKEKGIKKGQVISVKLPNSLEFIYCYFACIFGGYKICPISNDLKDNETKKIITAVKTKYFVDNNKKIKFLKKDINRLQNFNFKKIMGIFLTSGTTSFPKGICHDTENLIKNALEFNRKNNINENSRFYHIFPMNYMAGFLNSIISPIMAGGTIIFKEKFNINFAINFNKTLKNNNINYIWLNPTMLKTINHFQKKKVKLNKNLKVFVGTAPLNIADKKNFIKKFSIIPLESYGMTEILIFSSQKKEQKSKKSNVGSVLKGCKVFNNKKNELLVKSPFINKFNYNLKKRKYESVNLINKFNTGDIGIFNSNNNLVLLGRTKNIILKGGQNISPENIEYKISKLKFIKDICVCPIKDKFFGENICFVIETYNNEKLNISRLETFVQEYLPKLEFPKKILHVRNIPRSKNQKILRKNLILILSSKSKDILYEKNY